MTEAEWLVSQDPKAMTEAALKSARATDRTIRLFVAAFWGWQARRLPDDLQREGLVRRVAALEHWAETAKLPKGFRVSRSKSVIFFNSSASEMLNFTTRGFERWEDEWRDAALRIQPYFMRDIFGNPFRPVTFSPEWRTNTAVLLARQMYDSREFGAIPILADALQDTGCNNDDILNHCRDPEANHVRGCWVVDLVLGKT